MSNLVCQESSKTLPGLVAEQPFKRCGCGASYSWGTWQLLPSGGHIHSADAKGVYLTEMRHCANCKSTIAVEWTQGAKR